MAVQCKLQPLFLSLVHGYFGVKVSNMCVLPLPSSLSYSPLAFAAFTLASRRSMTAAPGARLPSRTISAASVGDANATADVGNAVGAHRRRRLALYSKKGCCLCDGLKEKLEAVFLMGGQDSLTDVELEVRDITTKSEWEMAYQYEIPVLACVNDDNSESVLPRLSPRLSIEQLQKKLSDALK